MLNGAERQGERKTENYSSNLERGRSLETLIKAISAGD